MIELMTKLVYFLDQILDNARTHRGHILIRKQHCMGCSEVLAVEITDKLGLRGEYWVVKDSIRSRAGMDLLYGQQVWFGNYVRCPNCGRSGKLPMDKPLNAENIELPKEVKDGSGKSPQGIAPKAR